MDNQQSLTAVVGWGLAAAQLAFFTMPAICFFYSGRVRRKSALSVQLQTVIAFAITSVAWYMLGFSLALSPSGSWFIGNLHNAGLRNVLTDELREGRVPPLLLYAHHNMVACASVALVTIATAERGRLSLCFIFAALWIIVVYVPIACWMWSPHGWLNKLGAIDRAGSTAMHISAGTSMFTYSARLGKRSRYPDERTSKRQNNSAIVALGMACFWVGTIGIVSSPASPSVRTVVAITSTSLASCVGGITWSIVDYLHDRKVPLTGLCDGFLAGLIAISSGAGFVPVWAGLPVGITAGVACNFARQLKYRLQVDDAFNGFAVHVVGGSVGNILTAFFATNDVILLDGFTAPFRHGAGAIDGHWLQLPVQLAASVVPLLYSACITWMILSLFASIGWTAQHFLVRIGLDPSAARRLARFWEIRLSAEEERLGVDDIEIGEFAYDYVEFNRDVKTSNTAIEMMCRPGRRYVPTDRNEAYQARR